MKMCDISMQAMPKALRNNTFTSFLKQYGLDLRSVEYISAEYRPGACPPPIFQFQFRTTAHSPKS